MDLILLLFVALLIPGIRFCRPITTINTNCFSKNTFTQLKGVFSLVIVFHHLSKRVYGMIFGYLIYVGYLSVAVFFFISGFGLAKKLQTSKCDFNYICKKSIQLVCSAFFVNIVYYLYRSSFGQIDILEQVKLTLSTGWPFLSTTWFVFELVIYYFVFVFVSNLIKDNKTLIVLMIVFGIGFNILLYDIEYARVWQESHFAFTLGIIYASYENKIMIEISDIKIYLLTFVTASVLFVCSIGVLFLSENYNLNLVMYVVSAVSFVVFVTLIIQKILLNSKILMFLGSISMWVYLTHEILLDVFRGEYIYIHNDVVYAVCVICTSVLISLIITSIISSIKKHKFHVRLIE